MNYGIDYQGGGDAYGGGGFNAGGGGGDAYNASQGSAGGGGGGRSGSRNYDEQTIIPVTCRMVLAAQTPDASDPSTVHLEDDRKLYHVQLVGAIRSTEQNSTNYHYEIEDGTGMVEVKQWLDENGCTALQEQINQVAAKEHQYVKIVGKIKYYDGKTTIVADTVRVLTTGNELAHHFLEVVYSGEKYKHNATIVQPNSPPMMMGINNNMNSVGRSGGSGFGGNSGGRGRTPVMQQGGGGGGGVGDAVQNAVLTYVQQNHEHAQFGANIQQCARTMPQYSEAQIREAVEYLQAEGMIYSTIDEDNYKCA